MFHQNRERETEKDATEAPPGEPRPATRGRHSLSPHTDKNWTGFHRVMNEKSKQDAMSSLNAGGLKHLQSGENVSDHLMELDEYLSRKRVSWVEGEKRRLSLAGRERRLSQHIGSPQSTLYANQQTKSPGLPSKQPESKEKAKQLHANTKFLVSDGLAYSRKNTRMQGKVEEEPEPEISKDSNLFIQKQAYPERWKYREKERLTEIQIRKMGRRMSKSHSARDKGSDDLIGMEERIKSAMTDVQNRRDVLTGVDDALLRRRRRSSAIASSFLDELVENKGDGKTVSDAKTQSDGSDKKPAMKRKCLLLPVMSAHDEIEECVEEGEPCKVNAGVDGDDKTNEQQMACKVEQSKEVDNDKAVESSSPSKTIDVKAIPNIVLTNVHGQEGECEIEGFHMADVVQTAFEVYLAKNEGSNKEKKMNTESQKGETDNLKSTIDINTLEGKSNIIFLETKLSGKIQTSIGKQDTQQEESATCLAESKSKDRESKSGTQLNGATKIVSPSEAKSNVSLKDTSSCKSKSNKEKSCTSIKVCPSNVSLKSSKSNVSLKEDKSNLSVGEPSSCSLQGEGPPSSASVHRRRRRCASLSGNEEGGDQSMEEAGRLYVRTRGRKKSSLMSSINQYRRKMLAKKGVVVSSTSSEDSDSDSDTSGDSVTSYSSWSSWSSCLWRCCEQLQFMEFTFVEML